MEKAFKASGKVKTYSQFGKIKRPLEDAYAWVLEHSIPAISIKFHPRLA